jgi:hypothetical protein
MLMRVPVDDTHSNYKVKEVIKLLRAMDAYDIKKIKDFITPILPPIAKDIGNNWKELYQARYKIEQQHEWQKWKNEIPILQFDPSWKVRIIPPFGHAVVRFTVEPNISVYLDCYGELGWMDQPYWEAYNGEETDRFYLDQTQELLEYIRTNIKTRDAGTLGTQDATGLGV